LFNVDWVVNNKTGTDGYR